MRDSLKGVLSRVKRLTTDAARAGCGGNHYRFRSIIHSDEPVPPWPEAESGERCSCGSKLKYFRIFHEIAGPAEEMTDGE